MELYFRTRKQWRRWLEKNYSSSDGTWLIYYKKGSGKTSVGYEEAVEEALCFGWIDSKVKRVNEEYYIQSFTPRRKRSRWSKYNIDRVQKLIANGLMTPAGMAEYQKALDNPGLVYGNRMDGDPEIPGDLMTELDRNSVAKTNFLNFPASGRRNYIAWLNDAKRPETRVNRINKIVALSEQNKRPGMM